MSNILFSFLSYVIKKYIHLLIKNLLKNIKKIKLIKFFLEYKTLGDWLIISLHLKAKATIERL